MIAPGLVPADAPRVTEKDIDSAIISIRFFTAAQGIEGASLPDHPPPDAVLPSHNLLTFCVVTLYNGFMVTGESACVSAVNFDAAVGRDIAFEHAREKIWPLMGFALHDRLYRDRQVPPATMLRG